MTAPRTRWTWEGWQAYCDEAKPLPPRRLSRAAFEELTSEERTRYAQARLDYHRERPPVETPLTREIARTVQLVRATNPRSGYAARGSVVVDGAPTTGKTTGLLHYARKVDQQIRATKGQRTVTGGHRVPVVRIGLSGAPSIKDMVFQITRFLGITAGARFTRERLMTIALDVLEQAQTELLLVDDLHCINVRSRDGLALTDHLKRLADDFSGTCVYAGVHLRKRGLFDSSGRTTDGRMDQTARRWTLVNATRLRLDSPESRSQWSQLVMAMEEQLILVRHDYGSLAAHADLLYSLTTGSIGSLSTLLTRAAAEAVIQGHEHIAEPHLRSVRIDIAAEASRRTSAAEVAARKKGRTS